MYNVYMYMYIYIYIACPQNTLRYIVCIYVDILMYILVYIYIYIYIYIYNEWICATTFRLN